jgi:hypothetical protein
MMMSFDEKLTKQFLNINIEKPNVSQYVEHIYADFVELNALFRKEEVTIADISDKLTDVNDTNLTVSDIDVENQTQIASTEVEKSDIVENRMYSIFEICKERSNLYETDEYPFYVDKKVVRLKEHLAEKQKLYLFLLLCSNLSYFHEFNHELTKDFEFLSYLSLKAFLPVKAIVKSFGKNSNYTGNAKNKILTLAKELGITTDSKRTDSISNKNSQERGLDLIAWIPFKDNIPNMLLFLCQCSCGKDWNKKQYDTQRFEEYFNFDKTPVHTMFVPYSLSIPSENKFHQHDEILSDHIFFDRKRIIEQLENLEFMNEMQSIRLIEKSISDRILV